MTWWARLMRRRRVEAQLDAEPRDHVERQVADYMRAGMSEPEARRRTRLEFGGLDQVKDQCRDVRPTRPIEELARDVRYACRVLRKSPGFTFAAVTSLALGIGANTAIFSLIDAALLKSLPVREPERLIELLTDRGKGQPYNSFSGPALAYFRDHATTLDAVIASHTTRFFVVVDNAAPELAGGQYVTGNFFEVLGVRTVIGRPVYSSDDRPNAEPVAVLSHAYWHRRFGADPLAVGRRMTIDDHVFRRRTSEIGIRMALGAQPSRISRMVVREALMLTAGGVVAGIAGALLLSRTLASLLFGLTPTDPLTIWAVVIVMLLTGLAAAYFPSRRAAGLDPTVALRHE